MKITINQTKEFIQSKSQRKSKQIKIRSLTLGTKMIYSQHIAMSKNTIRGREIAMDWREMEEEARSVEFRLFLFFPSCFQLLSLLSLSYWALRSIWNELDTKSGEFPALNSLCPNLNLSGRLYVRPVPIWYGLAVPGVKSWKRLSMVRPVPSLVRVVPHHVNRHFFVCFAPNLQKTNKHSAVPNSKDITMECT